MTAMRPWKMEENRTSIDVSYVDRRSYVNARSVATWLITYTLVFLFCGVSRVWVCLCLRLSCEFDYLLMSDYIYAYEDMENMLVCSTIINRANWCKGSIAIFTWALETC